MAVTNIDDDIFQRLLESNTTMFIHFSATWSSPCETIVRPEFERLSNDYNGRVNFYEMDIDRCSETVEKFGVRSVPSLMVFKAREMRGKSESRAIRGAEMKKLIDRYI